MNEFLDKVKRFSSFLSFLGGWLGQLPTEWGKFKSDTNTTTNETKEQE